MSKFMFHIRFSCEEDYLHQHELYEMLRSRNLYQVQFDLKKRLEKRIRSIEQAEKMEIATSQSKKTMFLQTVKERIKKRNRFGERYKRHFSLGDVEEEEGEVSKTPRMYPRQQKEDPPSTNEREISRSQTAPEMGVPQSSKDVEAPLEEEITLLRRNVTFCGKSFPMAKSAKRRPKPQYLQSVEENKEVVESTEDGDNSGSDLRLPDIKQETPKTDEGRRERTLSPAKLAVVKNMSMYESGVTAPDGRLILSRQDYDEFIDQYRQAQKNWLKKQRRKSESLEEKIKNFKIVDEEPS
ncbi:uncharacterized protein LOC133184429 [Saccostrea echinata]|uniref:uncharacterized protein LOC133184429 n=1 Tax=Saccostrea echinata TaxID=191078 RepID=UPI002A83C0B2|nr:uncharacterized protein LOC133184429 [Saccostrea echinata]